MREELYLGVDGGQSHTEAVIADRSGHLLGRGRGGPSNHAEQPGGAERLRRAVIDSVGGALRAAAAGELAATEFAAAHCAMTGGADNKRDVIAPVLAARRLEIGHDAPAALAGATAGAPGIVVIAGTGSVAYGEKSDHTRLRVGGWGYLFGDEGSGFWLALRAVQRAMAAHDGLAPPTSLAGLALEHFGRPDLMALSKSVYHENITRDRFATFAPLVDHAAAAGDTAAREIIEEGARSLVALIEAIVRRLRFAPDETRVACVGGAFGAVMRQLFVAALADQLPSAQIITPRFDPAVGALLLAYRAAGRELTEDLLSNLARGAHARKGGGA